MPKVKQSSLKRHDPLHIDLSREGGKLRTEPRRKKKRNDEDELNENKFIDAQTSRKILKLAREQQEELDSQEDLETVENDVGTRFSYGASDEEEDWESEDDEEEFYNNQQELDDEIDPFEEELFARYTGTNPGETINLADKIMEKIREKELAERQRGDLESSSTEKPQGGVYLPPKVIEVYTKVGELLSRYRSGKLPKAFKIIPTLKNWEDVLYVTQPDQWSTQATYEATKLFVSNLTAPQAQKFIRMVLYDRFRDDIQHNKKLNYHIYRALRKSLYKPVAFFKGLLFPLVEEEDGACTLREAVILSSVLAKVSIPSLHSSAALMRLAEYEGYSGAISLFIKVLLDKKYALPYRVIDAVVFHFIPFREYDTTKIGNDPLPVVWHQSLLVFAQRYKNDITDDQRDALLAVCKAQPHAKITPEIRRELLSGVERGVTQMDI